MKPRPAPFPRQAEMEMEMEMEMELVQDQAAVMGTVKASVTVAGLTPAAGAMAVVAADEPAP